MPSGRSDGRQPGRRGERTPSRRTDRSATTRRRPRGSSGSSNKGNGKRPGGQGSGRPQPSTGGAFKLSSTRRAAVLAILVCAMALSVSVPLRTYLSQRDELAMHQQQQEQLRAEVRKLEQRKDRLSDPQHVEAEARRRLGYVRPGETPFVVHLPERKKQQTDGAAPAKPTEEPWYQQLWNSLTGKE